ncbi:hypothetical protein B5M44_04200 [Shinella sumterensis]|uniref:hypothetical protein n=1 Tax=Shinella sumterensis TaxID=1967501 RepID=UPI001103B91F|nr:hypothetical protein [Shinella sumterensis]TFE99407.1 hypothetical protein B5M44_04200 [Shinella sumterensis]
MAEQLHAAINAPPKPLKAANDNKPQNPRYRGTLPALRWLYDNHPELAPALAAALPRPAANWFVDVEPTRQEIRPTIGEIMAASHDKEGNVLPVAHTSKGRTEIGSLKFLHGRLTEWGVTKKGKKLKPTDRARSTEKKTSKERTPWLYLATKATTPSPMHAAHCHRDFSGLPALAPMYDPLPGVEAARKELQAHGVDGGVPAGQLPHAARLGPDAVAEGASFMGGVCSPTGNSSSGAVMWEAPEERGSDAAGIIDEVAARGNLKSIGLRLGFKESEALEAGKAALVELAEILVSIDQGRKLRAA